MTKFGTASSRLFHPRTIQSTDPRSRAEASPVAVPISSAMIPAISVSSPVTISRGTISPITFRLVANDDPRSPVSAWPSHTRYCRHTGRSSPRSRRMVSNASAEIVLVPAEACAKSPGKARINTKATIDTPSRIGTTSPRRTATMRIMAALRRRPRYLSIQAVRTKVRIFAASGT